MTPNLFLTAIVALCVLALLVFALIGALHMVHVFRSHRRPWDDQPPPASWLAKQERGE